MRGVTVPENAVVVEFAPHQQILSRVSTTMTHGGHGTLIASLTHGVPLVCLPNPLVADQTLLALQVERLGAGRTLDGEQATAADITEAVEALIHVPTYRTIAGTLARSIRNAPGVVGAASRLASIPE
jgi:UDP:flavonoid glycosyltransferase YjiC (YdhE family)